MADKNEGAERPKIKCDDCDKKQVCIIYNTMAQLAASPVKITDTNCSQFKQRTSLRVL